MAAHKGERIGRGLRALGRAQTALVLLLLALVVVGLPGCGGCARDPDAADKAAEAKKKEQEAKRQQEKPPFEIGSLNVLPNDVDRIETASKPGHWIAARVVSEANHADFSGEFATQPLPLEGMPYRISSRRPIVLPKGQRKSIDTIYFLPVGFVQQQLTTQLLSRRGAELSKDGHPVTVMPEQQYFLTVLANDPDKYRYLRAMDVVRAPSEQFGTASADMHYRVILPRLNLRAPLSNNPLAWTSIAYVLWDDPDLNTLTLPQQQAMLDWLYWGGQLLISGPDSLAALKGTFLEPVLPAHGKGALELTEESLTPLVQEAPSAAEPLVVANPWRGESLELQEDAVSLLESPAGEPLVAERRVGAGRVVATAFGLDQRELVAWDGYDAFFNAYLFRRPSRRFSIQDGDVAIRWENHLRWHDPALSTRLRFFSRDAEDAAARAAQQEEPESDASNDQADAAVGAQQILAKRSAAGWNSDSAIARLVQQSSRDATRINIPNSRFVVRMLALYLFVLAPLNWCVFRAIGRVEWAWIAAPIIALIGAVVVVRAAQLDIGFVRASTEIATLELYDGHPRAHLTRFTTLYTSLSTEYDLAFADATAVALPFSLGVEQLRTQGRADVVLDRADQIVLRGFPVLSNSVGTVHSEQMFDLGGAVRLTPDPARSGEWRLTNGAKLTLRGVGVLQPQGAAWVGDLPPGESRPLDFSLALGGREWQAKRETTPETAAIPTSGVASLAALIQFAEGERANGEWRLVAWTDEELAGLDISPRAAQSRRATLVVAHLRPEKLPPIEVEASSRAAVKAEPKHQPQGDTRELNFGVPDAPIPDAARPAAPPANVPASDAPPANTRPPQPPPSASPTPTPQP